MRNIRKALKKRREKKFLGKNLILTVLFCSLVTMQASQAMFLYDAYKNIKDKVTSAKATYDSAKKCAKITGYTVGGYLTYKRVLKPLERSIVGTGLFIELPVGIEAQVRPRSGLAAKKGVTVLNAPGTIDADYRGEIGVILVNLSNEDFTIENGERIAQLVIAKHDRAEWVEVQELSDTVRGEGGFGSTGTK